MENNTTKTIVTSALLVALSVILRLLGFPQDGVFRIEFGYLPVALGAALYGPFYGALIYIIADVIGTLFTGMSPFFPITLCKLLTGVIFGLFFFKHKKDIKTIIICSLVISVLIDLVLMPLALIPISGGKGLYAIFITRLIASGVNLPARIISLILLFKYINIERLR